MRGLGKEIDLAAIDANAVGGGADDAFAFIGAAAFSNTAGERASALGTNTLVTGDIDGDGGADFHILPCGTYSLTAATSCCSEISRAAD